MSTFFSHACPYMCARTSAQKAEIGMNNDLYENYTIHKNIMLMYALKIKLNELENYSLKTHSFLNISHSDFSKYPHQRSPTKQTVFCMTTARVHAQSLSCIRLFVNPWTVAHQPPLPMGFPREEY